MAEIKPKSFRIDDATAEKFKEIASVHGENQQDTLSRLIQTYELEQSKLGLAGQSDQIETVQRYTSAIISIYMNSLQANQDMRAVVYEEFSSQLKAKDSALEAMREKLEAAEQAAAQVDVLKKEKSKLEAVVAEKEIIIAKLTESQTALAGLQALVEKIEKLDISKTKENGV